MEYAFAARDDWTRGMDAMEHRETEADASRELRETARRLGFFRLGFAAAGPSRHRDRFAEWLAHGRHGTMSYMARQVARRVDPRVTLPGAATVIVASLPYESEDTTPPVHGAKRGKFARYARGRDYHRVMKPLLAELAAVVSAEGRWRVWSAVDTAPILERDWAEASGVGWIGKNALAIDAAIGSYFFLGLLVTDRVYPPDAPALDHCGTCRACLDACPTEAFVAPRTVDARRCISYLTIEHRGKIDPSLEGRLHGWVFGCDICQEVCPFNGRRGRTRPPVHGDFLPRAHPDDLEHLSQMERDEFRARFSGTPVMRAGVDGMQRNARLNLRTVPSDGKAPGREA